jgi:hypothetical protein
MKQVFQPDEMRDAHHQDPDNGKYREKDQAIRQPPVDRGQIVKPSKQQV